MRVIGYKWLFLAGCSGQGRVALESGFDGREWIRGVNCASYAPEDGSLWGFNAYHSARRALWYGRRFGTVLVGVTGFGTVSLFEHGWRAEKAEIVAICLPRLLRHRIWTDDVAQLSTRLRNAYDAPVVVSLRALRTETERWGVAANALLEDDSRALSHAV